MTVQVVVKPVGGYYKWLDDLLTYDAGNEYRECLNIAAVSKRQLEQIALLSPETNRVYFSLSLTQKY